MTKTRQKAKHMNYEHYVCPQTHQRLTKSDTALVREDGKYYPFVIGANGICIPNFLQAHTLGEMGKHELAVYDHKSASAIYHNYLEWLFKTFDEDQTTFRKKLIQHLQLKNGDKVLVTGCGLGDDIAPILEIVGENGSVYANDLAENMVMAATQSEIMQMPHAHKISFSICDACALPFDNNFFDATFHFGGINLFDDVKQAIGEMNRVVKPSGQVVFGDEGVAPWLRKTEYAKIVINNNALWSAEAPIDALPETATNVQVTWVLGNCFYVISFQKSLLLPKINMDVIHKGRRGGNMRTRYFGQLEGVSAESKQFVLDDAARKGMSVHDWLEWTISQAKKTHLAIIMYPILHHETFLKMESLLAPFNHIFN
jgi:ubiquinone/menaquinone biosynthesis C-methylase UbiE